jgi:hypothetical protein
MSMRGAFLLLIMVAPLMAVGSQGAGPAMTAEQVKGVWEGILVDQNRVFVVVASTKRTRAAMVTVGRGRQTAAQTFDIAQTDVSNGVVTWNGVSDSGESKYRLQIAGEGSEAGGIGLIKAKWTLANSAGKEVAEWHVALVGREQPRLSEFVRAADTLRQQLRRE